MLKKIKSFIHYYWCDTKWKINDFLYKFKEESSFRVVQSVCFFDKWFSDAKLLSQAARFLRKHDSFSVQGISLNHGEMGSLLTIYYIDYASK